MQRDGTDDIVHARTSLVFPMKEKKIFKFLYT